jgi:shikimate kinase
MPAVQARRLILIGMMGSGKTTAGRSLSRATGWPYFDNDELLRSLSGRSAADLGADGEAILRAAEAAALAEALQKTEPCIVSAAAGVVLTEQSRRAMHGAGLVIWLRARPETLAGRVRGSVDRPWLEGDALQWMRQTAREREPLYADVADVTLDVDDLGSDEVAASILAQPEVKALMNRRRDSA